MKIHQLGRLNQKRSFPFLTGGVLLLVLVSIFLGRAFGQLGQSEYDHILAGEKVPFDTAHTFNIERLDREIAANMNEAQMMLIWKKFPLYKPMITKKLKEAGLPEDIFYLAIAESALKDTAISSAGAGGIWQFMPATAKGYDLRVDEQIDERFDVEKATDAAIAYLKKAHEKFGNWTLAMAAYNRGSSGIAKDMSYQYQSSYYDLYLNNETYRYIFRILAFKEIFENLDRYFDTHKRGGQYQIPQTEEKIIGKTEDLAIRAAMNGFTYLEVKTLNPWIRSKSLPDGVWKIKVYKR